RAWNSKPMLVAGLAALTLNSALDSASFWTTNYPHVWILLGLIGSSKPGVRCSWPIVRSSLLAMLAVSFLFIQEDRYIVQSTFYWKQGNEKLALKNNRWARICVPLDSIP